MMAVNGVRIDWNLPIPTVWPPWQHQCRENGVGDRLSYEEWKVLPSTLQHLIEYRFIDAYHNKEIKMGSADVKVCR